MVIKLKFSIFIVAFWLIACNNNKQSAKETQAIKQQVTIEEEDFETATKASYTPGVVCLHSGVWYLEDALLATSAKDAKAANQSVRIRGKGMLRMNFDVMGVSRITVKQAAYQGNRSAGWQLKMSVDGGRTYTQAGADMVVQEHRLQTVSFIINHRGAVRFAICKTAGGNNRINIDDFTIYGFDEHASTTNLQSKDTSITGIDTPVVGDNSNLLLGNPSNATISTHTPNNYLMVHQYYTLSYNRSRGGPNWVSWYVGNQWLGHIKRINDFRADDTLPPDWYHVQNTSYQGSGFERGHNCPSADRSNSLKANSATFLMTNMIPQAPANNQVTWGNLEDYERMLVKKGNEVYVIMGNYGIGGYGTRGFHTTIDSGRIVVPAYIWKVIVVLPEGNNDLQRVNATTRVIAVITPNNNGVKPNWTNYLCTVRDIELATGYNLLSKLPKPVQDAIETRKDAGIDPDDEYLMRL
jgi:endonuclease G